jgi:hypothetical protein
MLRGRSWEVEKAAPERLVEAASEGRVDRPPPERCDRPTQGAERPREDVSPLLKGTVSRDFLLLFFH